MAGKYVITKVRCDAINQGVGPSEAIQIALKLSTIISLVQVGMLTESMAALSIIERDSFLTEEKVSNYISMCQACNQL